MKTMILMNQNPLCASDTIFQTQCLVAVEDGWANLTTTDRQTHTHSLLVKGGTLVVIVHVIMSFIILIVSCTNITVSLSSPNFISSVGMGVYSSYSKFQTDCIYESRDMTI